MEPKVLQRDQVEAALECMPGDLSRFWQRCCNVRCYLFCLPKIIPQSVKSRVVQAGGREECPQGKEGLGSCQGSPSPAVYSCLGVPAAWMADGVWLELGLSRQGSQAIWPPKEFSNPPLSRNRLAWKKPWSIQWSQVTSLYPRTVPKSAPC